ncbi:unnamed protein product [Peronospora belbahrii]|uniref:PDZ domain-containing protein n=1 Tax=Peronospora belbahrii TaxID=622444 RepID=A0ABN8CYC5_9STRA|nr:unnamed protein product [Peronospora belbahrii]
MVQSPETEQLQDYLINWNVGPLGVVLRPDLGADMPPIVAQLLPQPSVLKLAGVQEGDLLISINGKKTTRIGYEKVVRLLFQERLPMVLHFRSPLSVSRGMTSDESMRTRTNSAIRHSPSLAIRPRSRSDMIEQKERNPGGPSREKEESCTPHQSTHKKTKPRGRHGTKKSETDDKRIRKQYSVVWERGSLGLSFRAYSSKVNVPCVDYISQTRGQGRGMDLVCINDVLIAINGEKTKALGVEKVLRWLHIVEKPVVLRFHASSNRVVDSMGKLVHVVATENVDTSARPRRLTLPQTQPESEPIPRPPRRNNSVDHSMQRMERGYGVEDTKENNNNNKLQSTMPRRYSREREMDVDKQPIEKHDLSSPYKTRNTKAKERGRHTKTNNAIHAYGRGRGQMYQDGGAGEFCHEPLDVDALHVDSRIDKHVVISRRYQQHQDVTRVGQVRQAQLLPVRSRTKSAARDDLRRQHQSESMSAQLPNPIPITVPTRPRVASRESQGSNTSQLSFDEAAGVVARATGKSVEECEFGGVPVLKIKEGTVQSKLMYIYAKACLAKDGNLDDKSESKESQPARTTGNPLGRKNCSRYLSYTILQDDAVASNHVSSPENGCTNNESMPEQEEAHTDDIANSIESKSAGVSHHKMDESFAKMQKDISIQPQSASTPPLSSVVTSSLEISDIMSNVLAAPASVAGDFISLKDFVVKGGNLTERCTTPNLSRTATPMQTTDSGGECETIQEQGENFLANNTDETEALLEAIGEATSTAVGEETKLIEPKQASFNDNRLAADRDTVENQQAAESEKMIALEEKCADKNEQEHADDHNDTEVENADKDDDVSGMDSFNERDLTASVVSFDGLLHFSAKDDSHVEEEHKEFGVGVDDDELNVNINANGKQSMNILLDTTLDLVEEEDDHEVQALYEEQQNDKENEDHEEKEELEDGALSNVLVDELFRDKPDVREVIKDKPALMVLVKKSMIDEVQEILQSLQMELQFERHSIMAVGSIPSPPRTLQQDRDTEGEHCYRCEATGELAELNVASGQKELYCQECWELFFFSEDRKSPVTRVSKTLAPSEVGRLTADEDALDEALKYSFHDSSVTREDMIHPWQYRQDTNSMSSSIRDSNASSFTDQADETWL